MAEAAPVHRRLGRPPVSPGEPTVEVRVSVGVSRLRRLHVLAQRQREDLPAMLRDMIDDFIAEKLTPPSSSS